MAGAEIQHLVDHDGTACGRTTDRLLSEDQAEGGNLKGLEDRPHVMQVPLRSERVEEAGDVQRCVDRRNDHVETSCELLERIRIPGVVDEVRAELPGFLFLAFTVCESVDLTAPLVGELQCHMAQTSYADDADSRQGRYVVNQQWSKHSNATTNEGPGLGQGEAIGKRSNPRPLSPNPVGESTVPADDCSLNGRAQVLVT